MTPSVVAQQVGVAVVAGALVQHAEVGCAVLLGDVEELEVLLRGVHPEPPPLHRRLPHGPEGGERRGRGRQWGGGAVG